MSLSRRRFVQGAGVAGLGLLAGCGGWPGPAQKPAKVPRLGWLQGGVERPAENDAFQEGLREYGYVPGQTITIETRWGGGNAADRRAAAAALVGLPVDVIVVDGGIPNASAAREMTDTTPIVMAVGGDPVEAGLVASLAHPGGNVTGVTAISEQLGAKRLELLVDAVPGVRRVGVLWHVSNDTKVREWQETETAAHSLVQPQTRSSDAGYAQ